MAARTFVRRGDEVVAHDGGAPAVGARAASPASACSVVLPAPFGPRMAKIIAARHVEVDAVDGADRAEGLHQPLGPDREPCAEGASPVQILHPSAVRRLCMERSARRKPGRDASDYAHLSRVPRAPRAARVMTLPTAGDRPPMPPAHPGIPHRHLTRPPARPNEIAATSRRVCPCPCSTACASTGAACS